MPDGLPVMKDPIKADQPKPVQNTLDRKKQLPKNKVRLSLFTNQDGLMGSSAFGQPFSGNLALVKPGKKSVQDKYF